MQVQTNAAALAAEIALMQRRVRDLRPGWERASDLLDEQAALWFATDGAGSWPPLDPDTIRRKGGGGDVLVRTGRLRQALQGRGGDGIRQAQADRLIWGVTVPYARYVARRRNPLPDVDQATEQRIGQLLADHVLAGEG